MEMILPNPGNGAERNLDAFAYVQLAAKLDVAIGAAIAGVALADVPARSSDNSSISSDRSWFRQPPKTVVALLNPCSMSSVINSVPLRPHRAEPRVTKRRPKSFPRMQQPAPSSKLLVA